MEVTGLRNPRNQLERLQTGLMRAVLERDCQGNLIRKAGIMSIVVSGGEVRPGDAIDVELPRNLITDLKSSSGNVRTNRT